MKRVFTRGHFKDAKSRQVAATILQRRERLRIIYEGEDLTPRLLVHPVYNSLNDKRTAFDVISLTQQNASRNGSVPHLATRASFITPSPSYSSTYTLDEIIATRRNESFVSTTKESLKYSTKMIDVVEDTEDVPSQFPLAKCDSMEFKSPNDKVTIILKETETFFIFDMPQLTVDATTAEGQSILEENERYERVLATTERKTVNAETQTPQKYKKTRGTCIARQERKNHATIVNNWVMYDSLLDRANSELEKTSESDRRFKFWDPKPEELRREPEEQLAAIGSKNEYEDATRVTLRILASKSFSDAQKRFAGIIRQDPCDPNLELVYGLKLLWQHTWDELHLRRVSAIRWNPVNDAVLAAGYTSPTKSRNNANEAEDGLVMIWCAKNPSIPGRSYKFNSSVSDLDWSRTRPNLLAIGFYNGVVRVIDVSKKQLTVIRQSDRKSVPSYEPHWQVLWWLASNDSLATEGQGEHLYTCNQDGRIYTFTSDERFVGREILQLRSTEGKVLGVQPVDQCPKENVPIVQSTGVLLLRNHPEQPGIFLVGTEEGYVHRCSTSHRGHLDTFLAHNGPIYNLNFSPFCEKFILTCGADWFVRIWVDGINEPLLVFNTIMSAVTSACWSPRNSTIFASTVANEICIWDISRKSYRPASVTHVAQGATIQRIEFTRNGEQLVVGDDNGKLYVYGTVGMPLPPFDQTRTLLDAVEKALLIKPELLKRFKKLGLLL